MSESPETNLPLRLRDFVEQSKTLDPKSFEEQVGGAFLLHHGPLDKLRLPEGLKSTLSKEGRPTTSDRPFDPKADFLVFPVKGVTGNPGGTIWLGRSEDNDIVIPDETVSTVHAFLHRDSKGNYFIQDMNSMNGTKLDDIPVPVRGKGDAVHVRSGARLVVGSVAMTFLYAEKFRLLIDRLIK